IRVTERYQFTLLKTGVFNTDRSEFPMQHPLKLRDRPPKLIAIAKFVGWSSWKRHVVRIKYLVCIELIAHPALPYP
ncbi:MAG: hypothetical protein WAN76_21080, partial [Candidatus Sulfotelmatobacter sp.]